MTDQDPSIAALEAWLSLSHVKAMVDEAFLTSCDLQDSLLMQVTGTDISGTFHHCRLPASMSLTASSASAGGWGGS